MAETLLPLLPAHLARQLEQALARRGRFACGRFAPSPTGALHAGNLRTALWSWLAARSRAGAWLLRLDDLDTPRNRPGAEEAIVADLTWLGLHWDGPLWRQSERLGLYGSVLSALRRGGHLYPCRCSRRLLADISAPHGAPPLYPGTCRDLPPHWGVQAGRLPSWRLRLDEVGLGQVGDVVLRRADGFVAYHLATAVDELWLGIDQVVRGHDLFAATAPQVALMGRLGAAPPAYLHVPLWRDQQGQRLAKRQGGLGLEHWRDQGLDAAAVVGVLAASAGWVPQGSRLSAAELLQEASARFRDAPPQPAQP
ncbi:MAG: tRNA glutamyl-Q(34) synthetase GluQRS [Prochlorococcaceae cyanobacterium]